MSIDEWQEPPPSHGSYWLDRDNVLCQVLHVSYERKEIELLHLETGEEYLEWMHLFSNLYESVDEDDIPLHLLGAV
jgi:hypothetical protein